MLEKFSDLFNFNELINIIEKETLISKSEKGHIKNCALSGKLLMYKIVFGIKNINSDSILQIFKILIELLINSQKNFEEAILEIIFDVVDKISKNYYEEIKEKKVGKFMEKLLNLFNKVIINKNQFENVKKIYEFALIFILLSFSNQSNTNEYIKNTINNFLSTNTIGHVLSENSLLNYFKLLLTLNIRENQFHTSFKYLLSFLNKRNEFTKVVDVWNTLIDSNIQTELKNVSLKNYQFLIFNFSIFLLENYFDLKYMKQIFDSSYFENLMKFSTNKKFKYISSIVETLMKKLKSDGGQNQIEQLSDYSKDLLKIFGNDPTLSLSPQSFKNFYSFLFNNLNDNSKLDYVDSLCTVIQEDEDEEKNEQKEPNSNNINIMFRITALRQLLVNGNFNLSKDLKLKILEFFFSIYFNSQELGDVEVEDIIEDRMLHSLFAYIRVNDEKEDKPLKDTKVINSLLKIHKFLQSLIESQVIEEFDENDYKIYQKYFKKFSGLIKSLKFKESSSNGLSENNEKFQTKILASIIKIAFIVLILYLKNPNEYADTISDLFHISNFEENWQKVYTDLIISLFHKGNNTLSDFIMNSFRKISKFMNMDSLQVIISFVSLSNSNEDVVMDESLEENDDDSDEDGKIKVNKTNGHNKKEMFEDLNEEM